MNKLHNEQRKKKTVRVAIEWKLHRKTSKKKKTYWENGGKNFKKSER